MYLRNTFNYTFSVYGRTSCPPQSSVPRFNALASASLEASPSSLDQHGCSVEAGSRFNDFWLAASSSYHW